MDEPELHSTLLSGRYSRQVRFAAIGVEGQARISSAQVLICGCGALGSVIAERLARAGVGSLRIVDRDWVELSNLQRQSLFTEQDALQSRPKSVAAAEHLARINGSVHVEPLVEDITYENLPRLAGGCDLILDGTDNFETRFLLNDFSLSSNVPWIHGGCLGASGQVMTFIPGATACFRCLLPELPPREAMDSCDTAGVLGPAIGLIASWQSMEALKLLAGKTEAIAPGLVVLDGWNNECRVVGLRASPDCTACQHRNFEFLDGSVRTETTVLCGKNAVQLKYPVGSESLAQIADRVSTFGPVTQNAYFLRLSLAAHVLTIFNGGRIILEGTTSIAEAKTITARILGG